MNTPKAHEEKQRCGAKNRQGNPCQRWPAPGRTRCRLHGGASPRGIAHPNYKGKGTSRDLPTRMMDTYMAAINDPELLSLRADVALVDARLNDVLTRVDTGESGSAWKAAKTSFGELKDAISDSDPSKMSIALRQLEQIIGRGLSDYAAWHEVGNLLEQRRKIVESEQKRLVAGQQMISSESAMTLIFDIIDIVRRNIHDPNTLKQISEDITRLINRDAGERA